MRYETEEKSSVVFVGTDKRLDAAMRAAQRDGCSCRIVKEKIPAEELSGDLLVLPVPALKNGLYEESELSAIGRRFRAVAGGMLPATLGGDLNACGVRVYDYMKDEEYVLKNAGITAQLAIGIVTANTETALCDLSVAVTGDGRIGSALRKYLSAFGTEVRTFARSGSEGTYPYGELPAFLAGADFLINTVPARIIGAGTLARFPPSSLAIDLAGKPGGFAEDAEEKLGIRLLRAPGLPGKYAPESAGRALWQAIRRAGPGENYGNVVKTQKRNKEIRMNLTQRKE